MFYRGACHCREHRIFMPLGLVTVTTKEYWPSKHCLKTFTMIKPYSSSKWVALLKPKWEARSVMTVFFTNWLENQRPFHHTEVRQECLSADKQLNRGYVADARHNKASNETQCKLFPRNSVTHPKWIVLTSVSASNINSTVCISVTEPFFIPS